MQSKDQNIKPINFNVLVIDIIEGGALGDYPIPLGQGVTDLGTHDRAKYPKFPGDAAYGNGPLIIKAHNALPQGLIDAQNISFRDALKGYMPPEIVAHHLCTFYQSRFLDNRHYREILRENKRAIPNKNTKKWRGSPHERLSFKFNDQARKRKDRNYFTNIELGIIADAADKRPEIYQTVFALQAGMVDYLVQLKKAFRQDNSIDRDKKKRAIGVIDMFLVQWKGSNFAHELIPAMYLAYYVRDRAMKSHVRAPSMQSEVTPDDFKNGFELAHKLGVFRHNVKECIGEEEEREFTCPAALTIGAVMARDFEHGTVKPAHLGAMLGMIYTQIKLGKAQATLGRGSGSLKYLAYEG